MRVFPSLITALVSCAIPTYYASTSEIKIVAEVEHEIGYIQSLQLQTPPLVSLESSYQEIEIYESEYYGKVLLLDECLQLTERDAPHYNEMLSHVPVMEYMVSLWRRNLPEKPLNVLVIGGGDGYVVSELLKHSFIDLVDHVELDQGVMNVSEENFSWAKNLWDNKKVNLIIDDGAKFVQKMATEGASYDIVIQDSSDPFYTEEDGSITVLPANVLYSKEHFESIYKLLEPNEGVFMFQAETYNIPSNLKQIKKWKETLSTIGFEKARYGSISIPTYPTGQIGFYVAHAASSKAETTCKNDDSDKAEKSMVESDDPGLSIISKYFKSMSGKTIYYHPKMHRSAFDLPLWVEEYINSNEK